PASRSATAGGSLPARRSDGRWSRTTPARAPSTCSSRACSRRRGGSSGQMAAQRRCDRPRDHGEAGAHHHAVPTPDRAGVAQPADDHPRGRPERWHEGDLRTMGVYDLRVSIGESIRKLLRAAEVEGGNKGFRKAANVAFILRYVCERLLAYANAHPDRQVQI